MKHFLAIFTLALAFEAAGAAFYGNQSEVRWKTAETSHFVYHYPSGYTSHAEQVAAVGEAVYDSVTGRYPHKLSRVHVSLYNSLYSNGLAIPAENSLNLWLTNWDFKLRSSHTWLADVVTHEFSHLVSIEDGSKLPASLYGLQVSFGDYYNERTRTDWMFVLPFTLQPLWFAEGTAQYESERMGFDSWDTHRDMLLRIAVLSDSLLPLSKMHSFDESSLYSELGPYTQGFALVKYIAETYGDDAVPKIWTNLSKPYRATLSGAIKSVTGLSEDSLYQNWKVSLEEHYAEVLEGLGNLVEGEKLSAGAFYQDFPVVAGGYVYGISNFGGAWFDGGVFKMPTDPDSIFAMAEDEEFYEGEAGGSEDVSDILADSLEMEVANTVDMAAFADTSFELEKIWVDKGISVREVEGRGPLLAFVSYKNRNRHGRASFDIFVSDTAKNLAEVTHLLDAVYPDLAPSGGRVVFARREHGTTKFILSVAELPEAPTGKAGEPRDLWAPPDSLPYFNIYSPKWSPSEAKIVFGFFDDQTRGLAMVDSNGGNFKVLTEAGTDARDAVWLSETKLVYSADRNGIFNLYVMNLETGSSYPLTNVLGGAFTPAVDSAGIFYVGYDEDGFSLYRLPREGAEVPASAFQDLLDTAWVFPPEVPFAKTGGSIFEALFLRRHAKAGQSGAAQPSLLDGAFPGLLPALNPTQTLPYPVLSLKKEKLGALDSLLQARRAGSELDFPDPGLKLSGTRLSNPRERPQIPGDISLAANERSYKPIPSIPLFVPLVSLEEKSPDFTVHGDGELLAKIGLAVLLSDPLRKNLVEVGALIEVTNGFDYIDGGLNPDKEYDFFALWQNNSTPITFELGYSFSNLTSKDTVRYEDPRSYGDSIGVSNYAVELQGVYGSAGYSLFKQGDTLVASVGYDWANFNLYEDDFEWTYHKRFSAAALFGFYGDLPEEGESKANGRGNGIELGYSFSSAELYRSGTFSETFVVNSNGTIEPVYRDFKLHEFSLTLFGSLENPLHPGARLAAGGTVTGILHWQSDDSDTLDSYYYHPVFLEGYPLLYTTEDYNRSGTKTAKAELHYLFPIYDDWRKNLWIFETADFYIDIFAQVGAAWYSEWFDFDKFKKRDFWDRSVGLEFRMANTLFHSVPFDISLTLARALDRVGENSDGSGGAKPKPIDLPLPDCVSPTRIHLTLGTGLKNIWQNE